MRRPLAIATAALAALAAAAVLASVAAAATVDDLRAAGYTVAVAFKPSETCTVWAVSGHGVSTYINDCDADAAGTIASLADTNLIYERDWQLQHPDQLAAAQAIGAKCYSISRTAPQTDAWQIAGGTTATTVSGAELPGLAASLASVCGGAGAPPTVAVVPGTSSGGQVTVPGDPVVVAAVAEATRAVQAALPTLSQTDAATLAGTLVEAPQPTTTTTAGAWTGVVDQTSGVPVSAGIPAG